MGELGAIRCGVRGTARASNDGESITLRFDDSEVLGGEKSFVSDMMERAEAEAQFEILLEHVFGRYDIGVRAVPLISRDGNEPVRRDQSLFGPVPKRDWTSSEFEALPEDVKRAAYYLAAVSSGIYMNDMYWADFTMAFGPNDPIVVMDTKPQLIASRNLEYEGSGVTIRIENMIKSLINLEKRRIEFAKAEKAKRRRELKKKKLKEAKKKEGKKESKKDNETVGA
jgi:hypothetical protein